MAAEPRVTAERLTRALRCHGAHRLLADRDHADADPYWLPDELVQIDVERDGGYFIVRIGSSSIESAKQIYARARVFVTRR
jgi:hypothetical protein